MAAVLYPCSYLSGDRLSQFPYMAISVSEGDLTPPGDEKAKTLDFSILGSWVVAGFEPATASTTIGRAPAANETLIHLPRR